MIRPYAGMVLNWSEMPVSLVRLNELRFTQEEVRINTLIDLSNGDISYTDDPYPCIVSHDNKLYVEDGHHRIVVAIIKGQQAMAARVFKLGSDYEIY